MIERKNILFCGAFEGEIDILLQNEFPAIVTGVGISASIFHLQKYLYESHMKPEIIFCGSCGIYEKENYAIGDIVYSNRFLYKEIAELYGLVKVPELIQREISTDPSSEFARQLQNYNLKTGVTNSTNSITIRNIENEKRNMLNGIDFENMESFGLAYVAEKMGLNFTSLFSVTNSVGENGSLDWRKNWRRCSDQLQKFVMDQFN